MIALGTLKTSSAFKLLCRAKHVAPTIADEVSKQIQDYELDLKHAIENNEDEAGPDMDKDLEGLVDINDYVKPEYHQLIEDSKQFMGIKTDIKPHPCARLCYHKDLRYEVGLISLKPKAGETERRVCAYIEGATADAIGLCKNDLNFYGPGLSNEFQRTR